ncbi:uncharacterized protein B0J16DRAFT_153161 [Fusarium flagelliforme]|uniref:uncharacterized protein n=1 Tax=Fusarium flagelliforme TaxID=2675880 RepID=UPI001E8D21FB|nr:uncharacterized protein B0J16DRAFT_153161 [Fusarium flagelliforme]KAH7182761.1 hypothetical protein B0J16DRAFT_153161 [Fusarium flagelliforme]
MTEVGAADLSRLLQSKRNECSSIVTSRKRKLRELFAVATQSEGLPHPVLTNLDAPTTTPAEWQFLQANDIIQQDTERSQYSHKTKLFPRSISKVPCKDDIHCERVGAKANLRRSKQVIRSGCAE